VRVNEFSADDTFTNATADAVPVETAVEGYIDRRLGMDRNGTALAGAELIPQTTGGFLPLSGILPLAGNLRMGNNQIIDLATPTSPSDAVTKDYVDTGLANQDELSELEDTTISSPAAGEFLIYKDATDGWINTGFDTNVANSDFSMTFDATSGLMEGQINAGAIENADVSNTAGIAQSKLSLQAATTFDEDDGSTGWGNGTFVQSTLGMSIYSDENFEVELDSATLTGRVRIKALGISNDELAGSITNAKLSNSSISVGDGTANVDVPLGNAVRIQGTANEVSITTTEPSTGNVTFVIGLPSKISANVDGDIYNGTDVILDVSTGELTGNADSADTIKTISNSANSTQYLTFVADNNASATAETLRTDTGITYNPNTNLLTVGGAISGGGTITAGSASTITAPGGFRGPGNGSGADNGQTIGTSGDIFNTVYATTFAGVATKALYADLAENYKGDTDYEPGTVLVFGGDEEVTTTNTKGDRRVAGVVTTNPAHIMNSELKGEHVVGVALQGRVPTKVLGRVEKGDLLVTAAKAGYAIVDNNPKMGTVIGKALQSKQDDGYGTIEVVVGRV